ncbi:probable Methionine synthase, vitamin-B12 independent [Rhynchosporium graminicola]|uniref:Probable Methionine synthase, vitamin-B12 independent n=1 Tax=Rhynchosporium graminicola TaxID=2792576 RepID=A0A1E1K1W7_9HELO|nr:probable Methionine synthase, vitamin-B12 independent [Rhynchosporium commune]
MANIHRNPPFRAEHLGSLLRPKELLQKRAAFEAKELSRDELTTIENESVDKIVKLQLDAGFRAISDGEYRRAVFWGTFFEELEGMNEIRNPSMEIFRPYVPDIAGFIEKGHKPGQSCLCTGKIKHKGKSTLVGQFEYLKTLVPEERWADIKLTMIAPPWYHLRYKDGKAFPKEVYATDEEYFWDISMAYRAELDILYEAGVRNVQIDDPNFAYFCSEKMLKGWAEDKSNTKTPHELLDAYIKCYNDSIEKYKDKMHFGLHICRGNFMGSRHFSEGGYDLIAIKLFQTLNVSSYYLEYDTPRAGGFEPLLHLPSHKNVILGVITSKFPKLEDKMEMKERLFAAADAIAKGAGQTREQALERMGVSPQCGFASHEEGNLLEWDDMKNKLELVRAVADEVWPSQA